MNATRHMPALLALCLLSVAAAANAATRETHVHGPSVDTGNAEAAATDTAAADANLQEPTALSAPAAVAKPGIAPAAKSAGTHAKPATARGGNDDGVTHAPRWHSFLPGMFR